MLFGQVLINEWAEFVSQALCFVKPSMLSGLITAGVFAAGGLSSQLDVVRRLVT